MIVDAQIIAQPLSGEFEERIYDHENPWNSAKWGYIKFTESSGKEWLGQFRGESRNVKISPQLQCILVLSSDYLFKLNIHNGELEELLEHPSYRKLEVAPSGEFILADYYQIEKMTSNLKDIEIIESPIQMDFIEFLQWSDLQLEFSCKAFLNGEKEHLLILDTVKWKIELKN
ncbi:MAG: hypothetical protein MI810_00425 [Flavobacteriales bacterium]|nr:hypothetical protein [Flavobacteriales bacterium]